MSGLATRCPACSTIFRVVPDQLRVSDGWVRCGRCTEVFNAAERLVDVDTGAPARADGAAAAGARGAADSMPFEEAPLAAPAAAADFVARPAAPAAVARTGPRIEGRLGAGAAPPPEADAEADAEAGAEAGKPATEAETEPPGDLATEPAAPIAPPAGPPPAAGPADATPSFVRRAERAARWRSPRMRAAFAAGSAFAALLLAGQAVHAWRDDLAATQPALRPALDGVCALLGCRIAPPRRIESLSVESSGLVRLEKSALYRLSVALRNRAPTAVALPALELSLTDSQGRLLVRRVLRAADLGVNQATVAPGAELALQATLQAALNGAAGQGGGSGSAPTEPIAGYTIELFYP